MTHKRKKYDRQFKVAGARAVLEKERTVKGLSGELGIKVNRQPLLRQDSQRLPPGIDRAQVA